MNDPALVPAPIPLDEFNRSFCLRCDNRECSRAGANNMAFDRRVANWKEDLFTNVPRAAENDPNYASIRSQRFTSITVPSAMVGNQDFTTVKSTVKQSNFTPKPVTRAPQVQATCEICGLVAPVSRMSTSDRGHYCQNNPDCRAQLVEAPTQAPEMMIPLEAIKPATVQSNQENTPFVQGTILPGGPPAKPVEQVIEPGSSFTFDDE